MSTQRTFGRLIVEQETFQLVADTSMGGSIVTWVVQLDPNDESRISSYIGNRASSELHEDGQKFTKPNGLIETQGVHRLNTAGGNRPQLQIQIT